MNCLQLTLIIKVYMYASVLMRFCLLDVVLCVIAHVTGAYSVRLLLHLLAHNL